MNKFVEIKDPTETFLINVANVVAITPDVSGEFGCLIYTSNPEISFHLKDSYETVARKFI